MSLQSAALVVLGSVAWSGCGGGNLDVSGDTTTSGGATYEDAQTSSDGSAQEPAAPERQPKSDRMRVEIVVEGTGSLDGLDPQCSLGGVGGAFEGLFQGEGKVDGDGAYAAGFVSSDASFETPSGCEIPTLDISTVTSIVVRAELTATTQNCEGYCSAKARSSAEAQCQGSADEAGCRGNAEGEYSTSCETSCTNETHSIVAETALSASATAEITARNLTGTAIGEISASLTFDRIEDSNGNEVNESP